MPPKRKAKSTTAKTKKVKSTPTKTTTPTTPTPIVTPPTNPPTFKIVPQPTQIITQVTQSITKEKNYDAFSKEQLVKMIKNTEESKKQGWWQYYQMEKAYYDEMDRKVKFVKEMKEKVDETSELQLPEFIIKKINDDKSHFECPVCKDEVDIKNREKYTITVCGHFFCKECLELWTKDNKNCPTCRAFIVRNKK